MKTGIWIARGLNDYNGGERVEDDDTLMPMSVALFKGFEGTSLVYHNVESANRLYKIYSDQNIAPLMWGIPHASTTEEATQEGYLAGSLTASNGGIFVPDLEPSGQYWHGGIQQVRAFVEAFKQAGGRELRLCVDARNSAGGVSLQIPIWEEYAQDLNITYIPMCYYTEFLQPLSTAYDRSVQVLITQYKIAKERIYPALANYFVNPEAPMDGLTMYDSIKFMADKGHPGVSIFRRGFFTKQSRDFILAQPDPFNNTPPPPVNNPPPPTQVNEGVYSDIEYNDKGQVSKITLHFTN